MMKKGATAGLQHTCALSEIRVDDIAFGVNQGIKRKNEINTVRPLERQGAPVGFKEIHADRVRELTKHPVKRSSAISQARNRQFISCVRVTPWQKKTRPTSAPRRNLDE